MKERDEQMNTTNGIERIRVKGGYGGTIEMKKGQYVCVLDVKGGQVLDFWAIDRTDLDHFLSPQHCFIDLLRIQPRVGDRLVGNRRDPLLTIVQDDVGWHDMLVPSCDPQRYEIHFGVKNHRSCVQNFREVMEKYGWGNRAVPQPFNIFMNTFVEPNGTLVTRVPTSDAGDRIILQAHMDLIIAGSACPMDLTETGARGITDINLLVSNNLDALRYASAD
jgi:uncharacterized protein